MEPVYILSGSTIVVEPEGAQPCPRQAAASAGVPTSTSGRLRPPDDLTGPERALFVDLVASVAGSHFRQSDLPVLCIFVRACVMEQTASGELSASGCVSSDGKVSPWASILKDAQRAVSVYSRLLRLNPVARQSAQPEEPISYYEKMSLLEATKRDEPN
jgi:hypothetical protein